VNFFKWEVSFVVVQGIVNSPLMVCLALLTLWHPGGFGDFQEKKRLNGHGFAREFLRSGMLYRPGKSLKRHGKASSLHSKKMFCLGVRVFCE